MRALTINVHSHYDKMSEEGFNRALEGLADLIIKRSVDVIAIQECSQSCQTEIVEEELLGLYAPASTDVVIRKDNFAYLLQEMLKKQNAAYYWTFAGAKIGYGRFDEGLAILSKEPILEQEAFYFSKVTDYSNWKARKTIGIQTRIGGQMAWFYSVHMGWWKDEEEPFVPQIYRIQDRLKEKEGQIFLMGDFNSQAEVRGEGYDFVKGLGWIDTYLQAEKKDSGITVPGTIDGWSNVSAGMRIDYIFMKDSQRILSSEVVFNGENEAVISDHFGVLVVTD